MRRVVVILAAALLPAWQQEKDEAAETVREGLKKSAGQGGLAIKGDLDRESPFAGMGVMFGGLGGGEIEGAFTAKLGKNGVSVFTVENEKGRLEVYRKGGKTVQRQTWEGGTQPAVGDFAAEVSRLLNLETLQSYLKNAKDVKFDAEKDVDGKACQVVKGTFPAGLVEDDREEEPAPAGFKLKLFEVKKVGATFFLDKESGLLKKIQIEVTKGYASAIRMGLPGGEGEEGEEDEEEEAPPGVPGFNLGAMKFVNNYTFTVERHEADLSVEIPAELRKFFNE